MLRRQMNAIDHYRRSPPARVAHGDAQEHPMPNPCLSSVEPRVLPAAVPRVRHSCRERELVALVHSARAGDPDAWTRLVRRYDRMLRHIARSYRLAPAEVDDVVQTTWLNLFEAIEQIRDPTAIGAWLATATRRSALRRIQRHVREQLTDDPELGDRADDDQPDAILLALERRTVLTDAIARLPGRHRDLVTVLLTQPTLEYREVAKLLSMPTGSIGPIRARSLARLARDAQLRALSDTREVCL
jgi:RNA polymerase sigma factor (sigma-70 family)